MCARASTACSKKCELSSQLSRLMNISRKFSKVVKSQQSVLNAGLVRNFASKGPKDVKPKIEDQDHYKPEVNQAVTSAGIIL